MKVFSAILFMLFLSWGDGLHAQMSGEKPIMHFKNISGNRGLPGEWARCMFQDRRGLMWFGTDINFKYFDGYTYVEYPLLNEDRIVSVITEDHFGDIWAFANGNAMYHLDRKKNVVTRYQLNKAIGREDSEARRDEEMANPLSGSSECLFEDSNQILWVSTSIGFMQFDWDSRRFRLVGKRHRDYTGWLFEDEDQQLWEILNNGIRPYNYPKNPFIPFLNEAGKQIRIRDLSHVIRDHAGDFWILTRSHGLFHFNRSTRIITQYKHNPNDPFSLSYNKVTHLMEDHKHRIWVATDIGGLDLFDRSSKRFYHYTPHYRNADQLSTIPVHLFEDRANGFWISHYFANISYAGNLSKAFSAHSSFIGDSKSLNYPYVISFFERPNGDIWITTDGGGLNLWHRKKNEYSHFTHQANKRNSLSGNKFQKVIEDKNGYTWVENYEVLNRFDLDKRDVKIYPNTGSLYGTQNGDVWIVREAGLHKYDPHSESFQLILPNLRGLFEDRKGNFWVWPSYRKMCRYDFYTKKLFDCFQTDAYEIAEDSEGNFWMLLRPHGEKLIKYNPLTQVFSDTVIIDNSNGQHKNTLIVDNNDHIWLGTKDGLFRYIPATKQLKQFDYSDGLSSNYLRFGAPLKTRNEELLFGSSKGFTIFHPDSIKENTAIPPIIITRFQLDVQDEPEAPTNQDTQTQQFPLQKHIHFADNVKLKHFQNNFTLEFAALNYTNPQKNQYKYKLEGYDEEWTNTNASRRYARYTNLTPNTYRFRVIGSNNDGYWNENGASLLIVISPPWYWAWWSKTLYALSMLGLLYTFYRFQLNRQLANTEAKRLKEMDKVKTRLYTNITHEFRTPLTVILGISDQMLNKSSAWFRDELAMIKRNSHQLLNLVNQMLDLSKLESGGLLVNLIQDDIIGYLSYLTDAFQSYAETKDIRLHLLPEVKELQMDFDPVKIQTIFSNLVINAIKFTPAGGNVYVNIQLVQKRRREPYCQIRFSDTGIGIPGEHLPHIFDRFYQADDSTTRKNEGTGIGLALTQELVKLLNGNIEVTSQLGKGTEFTIRLPVSREAEIGTAISPKAAGELFHSF